MEKNVIFEITKNIAIGQVLNMHYPKIDPARSL